MQKHSAFQAKGLLKIRPSPHSSLTSPLFTKVLWQVSCWWHHRCWIICQKPLLADLHPLWISSNWGHLRPKERRGAPEGARGRAANRQETWGGKGGRRALLRAGTSDPCVVFVCVCLGGRTATECTSCHQLEKTFIIFVECVCVWNKKSGFYTCERLEHVVCQNISRMLVCGSWVWFFF